MPTSSDYPHDCLECKTRFKATDDSYFCPSGGPLCPNCEHCPGCDKNADEFGVARPPRGWSVAKKQEMKAHSLDEAYGSMTPVSTGEVSIFKTGAPARPGICSTCTNALAYCDCDEQSRYRAKLIEGMRRGTE